MTSRRYERQYQLAAQKRHNDFVRYTSYALNAKYFEKQCGLARHYDSWISKDSRTQVQRSKRDNLLDRRERLRNLLKEEEETCRKEIEKLSRKEKPRQVLSLEALKEKLREKRTEQGLYLPRTCRKYQSCVVRPKDSIGSLLSRSLDSCTISPKLSSDSPTFFDSHQSFPVRRMMSSVDTWNEGGVKSSENSTYSNGHNSTSTKYSARYSRRSLENTNVNVEGKETKSNTMVSTNGERESTNGEHEPTNGHHEDDQITECTQTREGILKDADFSKDENGEDISPLENSASHDESQEDKSSGHSNSRHGLDCIDGDATNSMNHQKFEGERALPWLREEPRKQNRSEPSFLYQLHKDMKGQIEDLARRELQACTRQNWTEALRLRDMRNKLELIRERELYNMENLELEERIRKTGLDNIEKRAVELESREKACTNTNLYSEEAKLLWKQWVKEDESSVMKDARMQRETLMTSLEKEWKNMTV
ncbi:trichoplein keratin filament-binding protein-like isoform X4 [Prorops nasuta]|uniref:trichoplein keratin filament-binding protein-like isoform X3 n=1 Tax=Prorops nasuta TaxID=863751 RepID=UPI0034CDE1CB